MAASRTQLAGSSCGACWAERSGSAHACPQLGRRLLRALQVHQARFSYNPMGALRWKRDVSEYAGAVAAGGAQVAAQFEELQVGLRGCWAGEAAARRCARGLR